MTIEIDCLDKGSIIKAIADLNAYKKEVKEKADELCFKAAEIGADIAGSAYANVKPFNDPERGDPPNFSIDIVPKRKGYSVQATGDDVLYLEFGSGALYGYGHPDTADSEGFVTEGADAPYGPGTHSFKGHWNDPNGWWYTQNGEARHSYGNIPSAGMYKAKVEIEKNLGKLAEEIFNG